jgi:hypothetical protein
VELSLNMEQAFLEDYKSASKQIYLIDFLIRPYLKATRLSITTGNDEVYEGIEYLFREVFGNAPKSIKSVI